MRKRKIPSSLRRSSSASSWEHCCLFLWGERGEMRCLCPVSVAEGCAAPRAWGRLLQLPPLLLLSVPAATAVLRLGTWASLLSPGTELPTVLRHPQNG